MTIRVIAACAALFTSVGVGFVATSSVQAAPPRHHYTHHRVVRRVVHPVRRGHVVRTTHVVRPRTRTVVTTNRVVNPRTHRVSTTRVVHH